MTLPFGSARDFLFRTAAGWAVVGLLATLAAWPFLTRPGLPSLTDAELHAYRTYEVISAWQAGLLYLRWAPDLYFGFGYPVFNYYAPLTYYLGAAFGALGGGALAGVKFVFVLSIYLGALGLYQLARDQWGGAAGVVSAAAYAFAPYIVYIDPHARGALPEVFALALAPWALWALRRLSQRPTRYALTTTIIILTALFLAHNLMPWLGLVVALGWITWEGLIWSWLTRGRLGPWTLPELQSLVRMAGVLALSLGLAAFMWLPAWLERDVVQYQNAFHATAADLHFVSVAELFSPVVASDLDSPDLHFWKFRLGLPQWLLGLVGLVSVVWAGTWRRTILFFSLVVLACLFLVLPISRPLWDQLAVLRYLQFPWRLLGVAALGLSLLAGAATHWARSWGWPAGQAVFSVAAVTACVWAAAPLLNPLPWSDVGPVTLQRMFALERSGVWGIGTTHDGEFLPADVRVRPGPQASVIESYATGPVDKVDHASVPATTHVTIAAHAPQRDEFLIEGQSDFTLRVFTFYFPGWTAYLDGVKIPIVPADPEGWITVAIPSGTHALRLNFEETWPRQLGGWLSGLAGLVTLGVVAWEARQRDEKQWLASGVPLGWRLGLACVVVIGLGLARMAWDEAGGRWRVEPPAVETLPAGYPVDAKLEDNLALVAYALPQAQTRPGAQIPLTLTWQALAPVPADLSVFVHFLGPDGQLWGQSDKINAVDFFPTSRWPFKRLMTDVHLASLRPEAPPGDYQVVAGMWDRVTGVRRHVLDVEGVPTLQDGVVLTTTFQVLP